MTQENTPAVLKIAALARLDVTAEEAQRLGRDFDRILEAFRGLTELDVHDVEPMVGITNPENVLRDDERRPSLPREKLLAPAPKTENGFFRVPKTVDGDS